MLRLSGQSTQTIGEFFPHQLSLCVLRYCMLGFIFLVTKLKAPSTVEYKSEQHRGAWHETNKLSTPKVC